MKRLPLWGMTLLALFVGGAANAQLSKRASGPLGLSSDSTNYLPDQCISVWKGRVEATQDQSRLRADEVNVFMRRDGKNGCSGEYERIEASGNVFYVTPEVKARGDKAVYLTANETVTITGRVIVSSDQGVTETNRLVLNVNTNEAHMGGEANSGQRVRAVIYPSKKSAEKK